MPILERIFASLLFFVGLPAVVFFFVRVILRDKTEVERIKAKRELLEVEVRMEEARAKSLAEENRKYDRIIAESDREAEQSDPSGHGGP